MDEDEERNTALPDELEKQATRRVFEAAAVPLRRAKTAVGKDEDDSSVDFAAAFLEAAVIVRATIREEERAARKQKHYWYPSSMEFLASLAYLTLADCLGEDNEVLKGCAACSRAGVIIHDFGKAMVALRVMELLDRDFDDAEPAYPKAATAAYATINED